jgi:hypothetical protein
MTRARVLAYALALFGLAGLAATPGTAAQPVLFVEQGSPAGLCAAPETIAAGVGGPGQLSSCNATAECFPGTVSCSGNSTCSAFDRNCTAGERGHVTCDGVTTWCPQTCGGFDWCPACNETGDCFACCRCAGGSPAACLNACPD